VHDHVDQLDLVDQDAFLLGAIDQGEVLTRCQLLGLAGVTDCFHVLIQGGRKGLKEVLVYSLQLLERQVLKRQRACLDDAVNLVPFHIVRENLDELEHLCVKPLIVDFKMPRARLKPAFFLINLHREEFLQDMETVLEIRVFNVQPQLYEQVVVLVVRKAEAIALE